MNYIQHLRNEYRSNSISGRVGYATKHKVAVDGFFACFTKLVDSPYLL
jgi:hypothetical protein